MKYVGAFFEFWCHFIVGDDWTIAALVIVCLGLTFGLVHLGLNVWWLMPVATLVILSWGVRRSVSKRNRQV